MATKYKPTTYDPGLFKRKIEIEDFRSDGQTDDDGFVIDGWVSIRKTRAWVRTPSLKKMEFYKAEGINSIDMKEFVFRYKNEITEKMRIKYKDSYYDIQKVDNIDEEDKYSLILGKRVK